MKFEEIRPASSIPPVKVYNEPVNLVESFNTINEFYNQNPQLQKYFKIGEIYLSLCEKEDILKRVTTAICENLKYQIDQNKILNSDQKTDQKIVIQTCLNTILNQFTILLRLYPHIDQTLIIDTLLGCSANKPKK